MILEKKPITLAEVKELLKDSENEKAKKTIELIKKVIKIDAEEAKKLKEALLKLDLSKLKEEDIVKIVDFLPEDADDIRKLFSGKDVNLDQNEINKILETIKKK